MMKATVNRTFRKVGLQISRVPRENAEYVAQPVSDQPEWINDIIQHVRPFTMTSGERIAALCQTIAYVEKNNITGDIVECGVWRGGSMMAAALTLLHLQKTRALYLFDTFAGMNPPTDSDVELSSGTLARELLQASDRKSRYWGIASLDDVEANMGATGYPPYLIHYIRGNVEDTIPQTLPQRIAILRLDTDWYESTQHELKHLWPSLASGGIMIIDDYGYWLGQQKAVDEFCDGLDVPIFLNRIDTIARLVVKP
jgi:O-methyltransferase